MEKPYKKLTFAYNNRKPRNTNYSPHFLLFGKNVCLPVDLMFDILVLIMSKIGKPLWKRDYSEMHQNKEISQINSKSNHDKKIFSSLLSPEERVLSRNSLERGGTEKLRSHWGNDIYEEYLATPNYLFTR